MTDKGSKALTRLQKLKLMRILISGSFLAAAMTAPFNATVRLIVFLTAYGIAAYPVLVRTLTSSKSQKNTSRSRTSTK